MVAERKTDTNYLCNGDELIMYELQEALNRKREKRLPALH